jgi:predicted nucleic acid-binding protein
VVWKALFGKTVASDTAPLIYYVEGNSAFLDRVRPFFEALERAEFAVLTSMLTIAELLVKPFQLGRTDQARTFRELLAEDMEIVPVTYEIAELAAQLRADITSAPRAPSRSPPPSTARLTLYSPTMPASPVASSSLKYWCSLTSRTDFTVTARHSMPWAHEV